MDERQLVGEVSIGDSPLVLLGAGASVEAGVPASTEMTRAIVEQLSDGFGGSQGLALNFAVGAMVAHDTARGASPYSGIDVERLFAAVQMLGDRENLEVAPFVAAWAPALESIGPPAHFPGFFARDFSRALTKDSTHEVERLFKQGVEALVPHHDDGGIYRQLEDSMLARLRQLTAVDPSRVDYLAPLLDTPVGTIRIATLNYDRSVEELATRAGVDLDTGIGSWAGGFDWAYREEAAVQLLKLHGSIDWALESSKGPGGLTEVTVKSDVDSTPSWRLRRPAVVFGQRGKLRAEGPFLAMLRAFHDFLADADHLIVVGYSFRDDHINTGIRRWLNTGSGRRVTVVDPAFPVERTYGSRDRGFPAELRQSMEMPWTVDNGLSWKTGFRVITDYASMGLYRLFGPGPALAAPPTPVDEEQERG